MDDDPQLSDLWRGQQAQIESLSAALRNIGAQYVIRDGGQPAIRIQLCGVNGRPIVLDEALIPISAIDDLRLALNDLYERRITENEEQGRLAQYRAERDIRSMQRGGVVSRKDPSKARAEIRASFAEAARRAIQPDDLPT
ncbi:hypothetical protein ACFU98_35230 [Streptomyces sp. NPDC057575]|uniref:hypothetical protein n=1 Tax=unclassified Streptomyces TaxID=2593676 RepID=UPI00369A907D